MKSLLINSLFLFSIICFSQKINSNNYYDYYGGIEKLKGKSLTTHWLNEIEASQILAEEMKNAGFEWVTNYRIIKLNDEQYIIANCYSEKSKVGFVYEPSHGAFPKQKNREIKSLYKESTGNDYAEKIVDLDGNSQFIKIKDLPENIYIVKEDIYWFQSSDTPEDDKYLVTKKDMLEIFRSDIRKQILAFKK